MEVMMGFIRTREEIKDQTMESLVAWSSSRIPFRP